MNWLLDTDVISQPAKRRGDVRIVHWLEREKDQCERLSISEKTVRNHASNPFDKLGVWSRAQVIVLARPRLQSLTRKIGPAFWLAPPCSHQAHERFERTPWRSARYSWT